VEPKLEPDPIEEILMLTQVEMAQPFFNHEHFVQEEELRARRRKLPKRRSLSLAWFWVLSLAFSVVAYGDWTCFQEKIQFFLLLLLLPPQLLNQCLSFLSSLSCLDRR
jgi:hypothetical protein